jgi:PTS system cellobiose-specific IIB component
MRKKINVLLVCGAGASSSFMAAKMRLAAKKKKIDLNVSARAESEIVNFIGDVDAIMIGPHLSVYYEEVKERYSEECAVILMKKEYYSTLNGDKAIEHLLQEMGNRKNSI